MKSIIRKFFVSSMALGAQFSLVAQVSITQDHNADFESGYIGWAGNGLIDTVNSGGGTKSARLSAAPGNSWNTIQPASNKLIPVRGGTAYQLSCLIRSTLAGGGALIGVRQLSSQTTSVGYDWKSVSALQTWHSESLNIITSATTRYLQVYLMTEAAATTGFVWIDNISITDPNGVNIAVNYNSQFESGYINWAGNGVIDTGNPGKGSKSAKLSAAPGNAWNTIQEASNILIPVRQGISYQITCLSRQSLKNGGAYLGVRQMSNPTTSISYTWKEVADLPNWHPEYLTITPVSNTRYLQIYFMTDVSATEGAIWWDNINVFEINSSPLVPVVNDPFVDEAEVFVELAPLSPSSFVKNGATIAPPTLVPAAKIGDRLVGGSLSWKVVRQTSEANPVPIIEGNSAKLTMAEPFLWTIDLNAVGGSLVPGNYLLVVDVRNSDATLTRSMTRSFLIQ